MVKKLDDINFLRLNTTIQNPFDEVFDYKKMLKQARSEEFTIPRVFVKKPDILSDEFKQIFKDLEPISVLFFYRKPNYQHFGAHIDLNDTTNKNDSIYAINWILEDDESEMVWYNLPSDWQNNLKYTEVGSAYAEWDTSNLEEHGYRCNIKNNITLVRVDIPHNVCMGSKERLSVSVRFNKKFASWKDCVLYFKNYFT